MKLVRAVSGMGAGSTGGKDSESGERWLLFAPRTERLFLNCMKSYPEFE